MLATREDLPVWMIDPAPKQIPTHRLKYATNFCYPAISKQRASPSKVGGDVAIGRTKGHFGDVTVESLGGTLAEFEISTRQVETRFDNCPGMIFDLRMNNGGPEPNARALAGLPTSEPVLYAQSVCRNGPDAGDFGHTSKRILKPYSHTPFTKPVVCQIGPGCVSSGETMAMMLQAWPNVTLFGQATRDACGKRTRVIAKGVTHAYRASQYRSGADGSKVASLGTLALLPL